jgi:mercuric ion transport protein
MSRAWRQGLLSLPGVGVSLLPKLACPVCWPAYAGLLSSVGLGFLISAAYLLPLTVAFLSLTLAGLAFKAKKRHGFGPFWIGLVSAIAISLGKFLWKSNLTISGEIGLLVVASLWNAWPHRDQPQTRSVLET